MAQPSQERLKAQLEHPEKVAGNVGHAGSGTQPEHAPLNIDHSDDEEHEHHIPMSAYYKVFGTLMVLLFITVAAWYVDQHVPALALGFWSVPVALVIAVAKAYYIVTVFMHVKFSSRLVQIFSCTGIIFVAIMFMLTFNDYFTRHWTPIAGM